MEKSSVRVNPVILKYMKSLDALLSTTTVKQCVTQRVFDFRGCFVMMQTIHLKIAMFHVCMALHLWCRNIGITPLLQKHLKHE